MSSLLFGNGTDIVHWKPSPKTRGTFDILSSCVITMLLCVWTAVHLNVSPPGSVWRPRLRKVGWLILALIAPEMVAYTAWYQRREALDVMRKANEAYGLSNPPSWYFETVKNIKKAIIRLKDVFLPGKHKPARQPTLEAQRSSSPRDRHPWTIVHGFYAVMGGLAIVIPEDLPESERFLPSRTNATWFVGPLGLDYLFHQEAGRNVLPNLSEDEIKSKSKANGLAKALVCIQALWFVAQCITRLAQRIPISLLELNTSGHAVCALLIYSLWWKKPFEVDYPTMIKDQVLWDMCALRWMIQNRSAAAESFNREFIDYLEGNEWYHTLAKQEQKRLRRYPAVEADLVDFSDEGGLNHGQDNSNYNTNVEPDTEHGQDNETGSTIWTPGQILKGTGFRAINLKNIIVRSNLWESFDNYNGSHKPLPKISLTTQDVTRWKMVWHAFQPLVPSDRHWWYMGKYDTEAVLPRCKDWPDVYDITEDLLTAFGFGAAALIYGGLHASAWFADFDSSTEQVLWRISACIVMGGIPLAFALHRVFDYKRSSKLSKLRDSIVHGAIWISLLAYVLARAYLVIECFINLSHLPAGVYDVPSWSAYFPHIS